jgi:hypothetical protein
VTNPVTTLRHVTFISRLILQQNSGSVRRSWYTPNCTGHHVCHISEQYNPAVGVTVTLTLHHGFQNYFKVSTLKFCTHFLTLPFVLHIPNNRMHILLLSYRAPLLEGSHSKFGRHYNPKCSFLCGVPLFPYRTFSTVS